MPRKKRPLDRDTGKLRDASLVVIASEDTHAVSQYFARFRAKRVHFIVIPTIDGKSSPPNVMRRLDEFKAEFASEENDQFWICIDQDHWADPGHISTLLQVVRECKQKGYGISISNPCFELWLLLHFEDINGETIGRCDDVRKRINEIKGGYNKAKCCGNLRITASQVEDAIRRARELDNGQEIPSSPLTRMHLVLELLMLRESIVFE